MKLLLVGRFTAGHIGASLLNATTKLGVKAIAYDSDGASTAPRWLVRANWHLLNRRPPWLGRFSSRVVQACRRHAPDILLTTGCAPIHAAALREIGALGVRRLNYSTDDPWSDAHRSRWLLAALREYDDVFSPRRRNLKDLCDLRGPAVHYLPFAFDPELQFGEPKDITPRPEIACDVLFVGGADRDRVALLGAIIREGFDLALYGGYWNRYPITRAADRGIAAPETIREATHAAKVALCLVRRSNRDGHVMRSFEMAALGACMLVEDTAEHRQIFGEDGEAVMYFRDAVQMIDRLRWLLSHPAERAALSKASTARVAIAGNTYLARLKQMLNATKSCAPAISV